MKIIDYTASGTESYRYPEYLKHVYKDNRLLFMDIETTGFTARNSTLYLIGALWFQQDDIYIRQWFNDDGYSEKQMLSAFDAFCRDYTHLVHFNGLRFDLPYLKQKAQLSETPFETCGHLEQIDLFKQIRSYKTIFSLENMKQVSIEQFLGVERTDTYTGKELIHMYQRYAAKPDKEYEHFLLLHNHDDLLGMPAVSNILNYKAFFEQPEPEQITFEQKDCTLHIHFTVPPVCALKKRIALTTKNGIHLNAVDQQAVLMLPVLQETLKHYFPDYRQYYYLPKEDMAIHKSVAAYVETQNKVKATKKTCYIKKEDSFIPCFNPSTPEQFQISLEQPEHYQTLHSLITASPADMKEYVQHILCHIPHSISRTLPAFLPRNARQLC